MVTALSLSDYKLVVIDASRNYLPMIYGRGQHLLGLHLDDHHYDVQTTVKGFLVKNYFSPVCLKGYDHRGCHRCPGNKGVHCSSCHQTTCTDYQDAFKHYRSPTLECAECLRTFYGPGCLAKHKTHSVAGHAVSPQHRPVCKTHQTCKDCRVYLD